MISSNDFRTGVTVEIDNDVWSVVDFQHVKPGKGAAFVRAKMKNLRTGAVIERTFNAGEKLPKARIDKRDMQFLYLSDDEYHFMDNESYEQQALSAEQLGDTTRFLKENMNIAVMFYNDVIIGLDLPFTVELKVVETDPGLRGDTATGGSKQAKLETGHVVRVPLFIEEGEILRIDTRTGDYVERA